MCQRDYILARVKQWDPCLSTERRSDADVLISVCHFKTAAMLLERVLGPHHNKKLIRQLHELINARNRAAHGGWFTLTEYIAVVEQATRFEADLASIKIPK